MHKPPSSSFQSTVLRIMSVPKNWMIARHGTDSYTQLTLPTSDLV